MPTGTGIRAALDRSCAAARWSPVVAFAANAADAIADLAAHGVGVGVFSTSMASWIPPLPALVWRPTGRRAVTELVRRTGTDFDDADNPQTA